MYISFREKSLGLLIVSLVAVFGGYFIHALNHVTERVQAGQIVLFASAIVVLVLIQIIGHVVLAVASLRELSAKIQTDERDTMVRLKGSRASSLVLAVGVFLSLCVGVAGSGNFAFVHVLLAFWVVAQVTDYATQLVLYRRG